MPIPIYSGNWGKPQLMHLLRRTMFGLKKNDLAYFDGKNMANTVTELLTVSATPPAPPLNDYQTSVATPDPTCALGDTWVTAYTPDYNYVRLQSLRGWWISLMLNQERTIREKMVLFWHNLIPIDIGGVVSDPDYSYRYLALLRTYALGNFKNLVHNMTTEAAMLIYLDGRYNTKSAPNENYARELQELFTVGKDLADHYTEADVATAAKVLTGWKINSTTRQVYFDINSHDKTNKTFSAFYNDTIITGRSDATTAGADELNDLMTMIFNQVEVAKYIVRKLYRFFVYYKITATIETEVILPLADTFRSNGYNIKPVLEELFQSQHFYDTMQAGCVIKNPIDYVINIGRTFNVTPPLSDITNTYKAWRNFFDQANNMQMRLGSPPDVAGWTAYWSAPSYHESWVSAETLRKRKDFIDKMTTGSGYQNGMKIDVLAFTATLTNPADPNALIDEALELLHTLPSDATIKTALKNILLSNQSTDSYWTTAWTNYVNSPTNTGYISTAKNRLQPFYQAILNMAEYHLA